jgi:AcrR family transcriptional regulator
VPAKPPTPTPKSPVRGRPRSESARAAILAAARGLLEQGGYHAATIEAIAAKSGVAKTTIYRWWPSRPALVVDVVVQLAAAAVPPPAGRNPMNALRAELRGGGALAGSLFTEVLTALLGEAQSDPAVRQALLDGLFYPRRVSSANAIRSAQESGTIRKDVHPHVAVDLFFGPLFYRMFVRHEPLNEEFMEQVFDLVMSGLKAKPKARKTRR